MDVLLLGGSGVLSLEIAKCCLKAGHSVSTLTRGNHNAEIPDDIEKIICNVRNTDSIQKVLNGRTFDVIVDFLSYAPEHLKTSLSVLSDKCRQYIFISSCCAFRRDKKDFPITEISPKPNWNLNYSVEKFRCEEYLRELSDLSCHYTIVRPYITYGDTRIPFGIAPPPRKHWSIIGRIKAGKPMFVWTEDGKVLECSLLHSTDFANAFCRLLLNPAAFNQDINLVDKKHISWAHVINIIGKAAGRDNVTTELIDSKSLASYLPEFDEFLKGDRNLDAIFDNSKLERIIGEFRPAISLEAGIRQTIDSYQENGFFDGVDYAYDGAVDRMLSQRGHKNLKFVDYAGSASRKDKLIYFAYRHFSILTARRIIYRVDRLKRLLHL